MPVVEQKLRWRWPFHQPPARLRRDRDRASSGFDCSGIHPSVVDDAQHDPAQADDFGAADDVQHAAQADDLAAADDVEQLAAQADDLDASHHVEQRAAEADDFDAADDVERLAAALEPAAADEQHARAVPKLVSELHQ
jgi:hypothetical protein